MAVNEAYSARLPGKENGSYDAYRHLLLSAELTRRLGEATARAILYGHEIEGWWTGQSSSSRTMDESNNELGISIGKSATSWSGVVSSSKKLMSLSVGYQQPANRVVEDYPFAQWLGSNLWGEASGGSKGANFPEINFSNSPVSLPPKTSSDNIIPVLGGHYEFEPSSNRWYHIDQRFNDKREISDPKDIKKLDDILNHVSFNGVDAYDYYTTFLSVDSSAFKDLYAGAIDGNTGAIVSEAAKRTR